MLDDIHWAGQRGQVVDTVRWTANCVWRRHIWVQKPEAGMRLKQLFVAALSGEEVVNPMNGAACTPQPHT